MPMKYVSSKLMFHRKESCLEQFDLNSFITSVQVCHQMSKPLEAILLPKINHRITENMQAYCDIHTDYQWKSSLGHSFSMIVLAIQVSVVVVIYAKIHIHVLIVERKSLFFRINT